MRNETVTRVDPPKISDFKLRRPNPDKTATQTERQMQQQKGVKLHEASTRFA